MVDVDRDARGRRRQRKRGGFATKREAERALRNLIRTLDLNAYVEPSQKTLGQYLTRDWLPAMQPPKLRDTTWTEYRRKVVDQ